MPEQLKGDKNNNDKMHGNISENIFTKYGKYLNSTRNKDFISTDIIKD